MTHREAPPAPPRAAARSFHEPALTGMRGVASLMVLATHISFQTGSSTAGEFWGRLGSRLDVAVALFFALSGFLLFQPWARTILTGTAAPRVRTYLWRRALRVLPAYWVTLLAVALVVRPQIDTTTWVFQVLILQTYRDLALVDGATQMWSLGVEVAFYGALPLLAAGLATFATRRPEHARPRAVLGVIGAVSVLSLAWPVTSSLIGLDPSLAALWLPAYLSWFGVGMALTVLDVISRPGGVHPLLRMAAAAPWSCWVAAGALLVVVATPIAGGYGLEGRSGPHEVLRMSVYAVIAGLVLLPLVASRWTPRATGRDWLRPEEVLRTRTMVYLGEISYPVFLIHLVALHLAYSLGPFRPFGGDVLGVSLLATALSLVMAVAIHHAVEVPVARLARRARRSAMSARQG